MNRARRKTWVAQMCPLLLRYCTSLWMCLGLLPLADGWSFEPIPIEYLWQSQPKLDFDWNRPPVRFNIKVTNEQLNAQSVSERLQAVQSILRVPLSPTLDRASVLPALIARLQAGEPHRLVRLDMLAAACELDDGKNAAVLWKLASDDEDAVAIVARACVRWRSPLPVERWRKVLATPAATEQALLQAADGLAAAGSNEDIKLLTSIVLDGRRSSTLRLACARAIGSVASDDQLVLAQQLEKSNVEHAQLLAVEVLAHSPVASATEYVQQLALHAPPLAQRAAYRWLCQRDATRAQGLVDNVLKHADHEVRLMALQQLTDAKVEDALTRLFNALSDEHPQVREAARLHVLTVCSRSETQLQTALAMLQSTMASDQWRPLEQAIRLTVELHQKQYCDRLLVLMKHERPELCITACWALRHLGEDPKVLAQMLEYVQFVTEKLLDINSSEMTEVHLRGAAHLLEAFGHRKYEPAKETVLRYVPKVLRLGLITRMTAVWASGQLWENGKNDALVKELHARIADKTSMIPEPESVRFAATLALGYIGDPASRQPLIVNDEPKPLPIGYATEWSLRRLAGDK